MFLHVLKAQTSHAAVLGWGGIHTVICTGSEAFEPAQSWIRLSQGNCFSLLDQALSDRTFWISRSASHLVLHRERRVRLNSETAPGFGADPPAFAAVGAAETRF